MSKYFKTTLFTFLYLIAIYGDLFSQIFPENNFKNITVDDGLSHNFVEGIIKDRRGYIWFIGEMPNRYDGYSIVFYKEISGDTTSFIGYSKDAALDANGELWLLSTKGVLKYNEATDNFTRYLEYKSLSGEYKPVEHFHSITLDTDGSLIIYGYSPKILRLDTDSRTLIESRLPIPSGFEDTGHISRVIVDASGILWYAFEGKPFLFKCKKNTPPVKYNLEEISNLESFPIHQFVDGFNSRKLIFFGRAELDHTVSHKKQSFYILDKKSMEIKSYPNFPLNKEYDDQTIWSLLPYDENTLIIGYKENLGLGAFNLKTGEFQHFVSDINYSGSLSHNNIFALYRSSDNIIWIGTQMGGVSRLDLNQKPFRLFQKQGFNLGNSLSNNLVLDFMEDEKGNAWIGTDKGGLNKFNPKIEHFAHFLPKKNQPNSISSNAVLSLAKTKDGVFWIGTWNGGLNSYNPETGIFKHYQPNGGDLSGLACINIWQVCVSVDNKIWVGYKWCPNSEVAFSLFDPETETFTHFSKKENDPNSPPINSVHTMYADPLNNLWISDWEGNDHFIYKYDIDQNKFIHFNLPDSTQFNYYRFNCFLMEKEGLYWIGTEGGGLLLFDENKQTFKRFSTESHDFPSDFIQSIEKDNLGNLWIGTSYGLMRFSPKTQEVFSFGELDGLQGVGFNKGSSMYSQQGLMYFGGQKGFNSFRPEAIKRNENIPPLYITKFSLFNKESSFQDRNSPLKNHISKTKVLTLTHEQNIFSLELTAFNFTNPSQNQYAFYLDGLESDWNYVGNQRVATYTNLDPGEYTFYAKAANNDGIWNPEIISLKINILPPWFETWWFRSILVIFILVCIISFNKYRLYKLKLQKKILEIKVEKRTKKLKNATDEIHAQNEELQSQQEELKSQQEDLALQNEELGSTLEKLKLAQTQLVQSEKMASLGILTAGIAHEINNPTNFIISGVVGLKKSVDILLKVIEEYNDIDKENFETKISEIEQLKEDYRFEQIIVLVKKVLKDIGIGAQKTANIVNELRTFASLENQEKSNVDLLDSINSSLTILTSKYKNRIKIKKNIQPLPVIYGNAGKINQVFFNLILNAIQSIENQGLITIEAFSDNRSIEIKIKDSGKGIKEEDQPKIFEPFFSTKEVGKGTGLGLSIANSIIEAHKGKIRINSTEGEGTEVIVTFSKGNHDID